MAEGYFSDSFLSGIYLTLVQSSCLVDHCRCGLDVDIIKMIKRTEVSHQCLTELKGSTMLTNFKLIF